MIPVLVIAVGLHVEELAEVTLAEINPAIEALARAIREIQRVPVQLDDTGWDCDAADRCLEEIRSRTRASDVVYLRAVGGPARIQLQLERIPAQGAPRKLELLVERTADPSNSMLEAARTLFPEPPQVAPKAELLVPPKMQGADPPYFAWAMVGGGVVASAVGAGFFISANNANERIAGGILTGPEYEDQLGRRDGHGLAAGTLFVAGGALLIAGGALLIWELSEN